MYHVRKRIIPIILKIITVFRYCSAWIYIYIYSHTAECNLCTTTVNCRTVGWSPKFRYTSREWSPNIYFVITFFPGLKLCIILFSGDPSETADFVVLSSLDSYTCNIVFVCRRRCDLYFMYVEFWDRVEKL